MSKNVDSVLFNETLPNQVILFWKLRVLIILHHLIDPYLEYSMIIFLRRYQIYNKVI